MFQEYPKWVYCEGKESVIVDTAADEKEFLGQAPASIEQLVDAAKKMGIKVDARWGIERLQAEITKAA